MHVCEELYALPKGGCQFKDMISFTAPFLFCSLFAVDLYKDFVF